MPKRSALSFGSLSYQMVEDPEEENFRNVRLFFYFSKCASNSTVFSCLLETTVSQQPNVTLPFAQHRDDFVLSVLHWDPGSCARRNRASPSSKTVRSRLFSKSVPSPLTVHQSHTAVQSSLYTIRIATYFVRHCK